MGERRGKRRRARRATRPRRLGDRTTSATRAGAPRTSSATMFPLVGDWFVRVGTGCPGWESNPHWTGFESTPEKPLTSANAAEVVDLGTYRGVGPRE